MLEKINNKHLVLIQVICWAIICAFALMPLEMPHMGGHMRMNGNHVAEHLRPIGNMANHFFWKNAVFSLTKIFGIIILFYYNYYILIPKYYVRQKYLSYLGIGTALILFLGLVSLLFEGIKHHGHVRFGPKEFHEMVISCLSASLAIVVPLAFTIYKQYVDTDKEKTKAELSFLRAQINHHFLFNSLNNIYGLSIQGSKNTSDAIYSLSSIMRHMATEINNHNVPLQKELDFIHHFISLQKLRLSENTKLNYEINGIAGDQKIEPMLLLPFIENCFKHGVSTSKKSTINIQLKIESNAVILDTQNDIIENIDTQDIKSGVGLENVKKRLESEYPNKYELDYRQENGIYKAHLKIVLS